MRFPTTFVRYKGTTPASGTTIATTLAPPATAPRPQIDNVSSWVAISKEGMPIQRVAAYWTSAAAGLTLVNANLYLYDQALETWVLVNPTPIQMNPNQLYWFDVAIIPTGSPKLSATGGLNLLSTSTGGLDVALAVADPGTLPNNSSFSFAMGADVSLVGT